MDKRRWGLLRDPFSDLSSTARPYLVNAEFQRAYNDLMAATRAGSGCLLLTGASGHGKTTLLNYLLRGLPFAGIAVETFPQQSVGEEARPRDAVRQGHGLPQPVLADNGLQAAWTAFQARLASRAAQERCRIAVAADDADLLPDTILAEMLSLPATTRGLGVVLTVLMSGPPAFAVRLDDLARQSGCAIDLHCGLVPLSANDVEAYVAEAMARAGSRGATPFPSPSLSRVTELTNGLLVHVNSICGRAIVLAEEAGTDLVTPEMIDEAARELGLDRDSGKSTFAGAADLRDEPAAAMPALRSLQQEGPLQQEEGPAVDAATLRLAVASEPPSLSGTASPSSQHTSVPAHLPLLRSETQPRPRTAVRFPAPQRRSLRTPLAAAGVLLLGAAASALAWPLLRGPQQPDQDQATTAPAAPTPVSVPLPLADPVPGTPVLAEATPPSPATVKPLSAAAPAPAGAPPANGASLGSEPPATSPANPASPEAEPGRLPADGSAGTSATGAAAAPDATAASRPDAEAGSAASEVPPTPPQEAPPVTSASSPPAASVAPQPDAEAGSAASEMSPTPPQEAPPVTSASSPPAASGTEIRVLMKRGDEMLAISDAVSARLFYGRAAGLNDPAAMTAMAWTYDPLVLAERQVQGVGPEPRVAISWYQRAIAAGDPSAAERLRALIKAMSSTGQLDAAEAAAVMRPLE